MYMFIFFFFFIHIYHPTPDRGCPPRGLTLAFRHFGMFNELHKYHAADRRATIRASRPLSTVTLASRG